MFNIWRVKRKKSDIHATSKESSVVWFRVCFVEASFENGSINFCWMFFKKKCNEMKEMSQCCFKCDHYSVIMCACLWACVQSYNVRLLEEFRDQFNEIVTKMNFKFKLWTTFNSIVQPNCDISFSFKKIIHLIELRTFKHFITLIWWENATVPPNTIIIIVNKKTQ